MYGLQVCSGRGSTFVQKSAISSGWTPVTSPHWLPNSHLWLQAELVDLYKQRLQHLGEDASNVNSTRLKEKILKELPELGTQERERCPACLSI